MRFKELDTVVLDRDLPEHNLRRGDLGAVVQVYEPVGLEVEFVTASGRTQALVILDSADVRPVGDEDLVSVQEQDEDREWYSLAATGLAAAYGEEEPEYTLDLIKEPNPDYEGG